MEVDGKEFLRNVGIEQDKKRLIEEQEKLEELKRASIKREQSFQSLNTPTDESDSAYVDLSVGSDSPQQKNSSHNVEDIILEKSSSNNKKKYIVLGLGLILLFIITVLVIRLISNNEIEDQLNENNPLKTEVIKEDILNKIDSNEEYQKVIDRKIELEESSKIDKEQEKKVLNEIQVPKDEVANVPLILDTPKVTKATKRDLFELEEESKKLSEKQVKIENDVIKIKEKTKTFANPKKEILVPPTSEKNFTADSVSLKGYYIQLGAFTKEPNKNLLNSISNKGYSYTVYQLTIKGKLYNKVLIGSYKSRTDALNKLSKIKLDFNNPSAYVLKF